MAGKQAADPTAKTDVWKNFYGKLKEIKEYHKAYTPLNALVEYKSPKLIVDRCFLPPRQERRPGFTQPPSLAKKPREGLWTWRASITCSSTLRR